MFDGISRCRGEERAQTGSRERSSPAGNPLTSWAAYPCPARSDGHVNLCRVQRAELYLRFRARLHCAIIWPPRSRSKITTFITHCTGTIQVGSLGFVFGAWGGRWDETTDTDPRADAAARIKLDDSMKEICSGTWRISARVARSARDSTSKSTSRFKDDGGVAYDRTASRSSMATVARQRGAGYR